MIVTIDVGLKNLAMCAMSCHEPQDFKTYSIHAWDVYNTLEEPERYCGGLLKNGKVCNRKGSYLHDKSYTCKTHLPANLRPEKHKLKSKKVDDFLLQDIAKIVVNKVEDIVRSNWNLFEQVTGVYIELQPKVNAKMKFTSHIIYGKIVDLLQHQKTIVRFVRASQKLKAYSGPDIQHQCKLKGAYAKRKWLSVQYTRWFLENQFSSEQMLRWLPFFDVCKKSDDISDTALMAINALHGVPKRPKKGKCIK
jgi:hypothetical protein